MFKERKDIIKMVKRSVEQQVAATKMKEQMVNLFNTANHALIEENSSLRALVTSALKKLETEQQKCQHLQGQFYTLISRVMNTRLAHLLVNMKEAPTNVADPQGLSDEEEQDNTLLSHALQSLKLNDIKDDEFLFLRSIHTFNNNSDA